MDYTRADGMFHTAVTKLGCGLSNHLPLSKRLAGWVQPTIPIGTTAISTRHAMTMAETRARIVA